MPTKHLFVTQQLSHPQFSAPINHALCSPWSKLQSHLRWEKHWEKCCLHFENWKGTNGNRRHISKSMIGYFIGVLIPVSYSRIVLCVTPDHPGYFSHKWCILPSCMSNILSWIKREWQRFVSQSDFLLALKVGNSDVFLWRTTINWWSKYYRLSSNNLGVGCQASELSCFLTSSFFPLLVGSYEERKQNNSKLFQCLLLTHSGRVQRLASWINRWPDFSGIRKCVFQRSWHFLTPVLNLNPNDLFSRLSLIYLGRGMSCNSGQRPEAPWLGDSGKLILALGKRHKSRTNSPPFF